MDRGKSISGPGSTINFTEKFRKGFTKFLWAIDCRSLLDAPCGDFNWMKEVIAPPAMRYFGMDVVEQIVAQNRERYKAPNRFFAQANIVVDPLPDADVWLCRDCLFHLSNDHALAALQNAVRSQFRYLAITSSWNDVNGDVHTGGFRELNLERSPFNLPPPIGKIADDVHPWPARHVGIWTRDQVLGVLSSIQSIISVRLYSVNCKPRHQI